MIATNHPQNDSGRILGIALSTKGFGFAVFDGKGSLVDWGVKSVTADKNRTSVTKVKEMARHYLAGVIVLEDCAAKESRRRSRIRSLSSRIVAEANKLGIRTQQFSPQRIKEVLLGTHEATKHEVAQYIAERFPEELGHRLPPKRKLWKSEDARMNIFEAVSLVQTFQKEAAKKNSIGGE